MDLHRHSYEPNAKWTTQGLTEAFLEYLYMSYIGQKLYGRCILSYF